MSTAPIQQQSMRGANRGRRTNKRGGHRGGGAAGAASVASGNSAEGAAAPHAANAVIAQLAATAAAAAAQAGDETEVCWICAEPVKYWSVSECNHRTCHVCALRLRALYKKLDCTFCKVSVAIGMQAVSDKLTR